MYIVHVFIEIKPETQKEFIAASISNAESSLMEPGIARFDFIQNLEFPNHFLLVEVYHSEIDSERHKATDHYKQWKTAVEEMMAVPRTKKIYRNLFPGERGWNNDGI